MQQPKGRRALSIKCFMERAAEAALTQSACSTAEGGPAGRTVGGLTMALGELVVIWEDKSSLATVGTSQHFLAALAGEPQRVLDGNREASHKDHAARLPHSMANDSEPTLESEAAIVVSFFGSPPTAAAVNTPGMQPERIGSRPVIIAARAFTCSWCLDLSGITPMTW